MQLGSLHHNAGILIRLPSPARCELGLLQIHVFLQPPCQIKFACCCLSRSERA
jgi:hypothetical protein